MVIQSIIENLLIREKSYGFTKVKVKMVLIIGMAVIK